MLRRAAPVGMIGEGVAAGFGVSTSPVSSPARMEEGDAGLPEQAHQDDHRHPSHVGEIPFELRQQPHPGALDTVAAGASLPLAEVEVALELVVAQGVEAQARGLHMDLSDTGAEEAEAGDDVVIAIQDAPQ